MLHFMQSNLHFLSLSFFACKIRIIWEPQDGWEDGMRSRICSAVNRVQRLIGVLEIDPCHAEGQRKACRSSAKGVVISKGAGI